MSGTFNPDTPGLPGDHAWPADRLSEARAIVAEVVHHSDPLLRLACKVLIQHGQSREEREDARRLLVILNARRPARRRCDDSDEPEVQR